MKNFKFTPESLIFLIFCFFTGCVKEESFTEPLTVLNTCELVPTTTVLSIREKATSIPVGFVDDEIIEGYVTSSDEKGNFFKTITFQTFPVSGESPVGFCTPINATSLSGKGFIPGRKVYIKLKGLYYAEVYGSLQIGSLYEDGIGRISEFEWQEHLFLSATVVSEEALMRSLRLDEAYADANQNTLIELDAVEFADSSLNRTYYDTDDGGGGTNHHLVSLSGNVDGIIRFSKYCPFTGKPIPVHSGKVRGVLMKYGADFQFVVRYEKDLQLTEPRFDVSPPQGGTDLVYFAKLNESFSDFEDGAILFPDYINDAAMGSRYWSVKKSGSNKYLQISAFGGTPERNRAVFVIPVDFTKASSFSFKTKSGYDNGSSLKIYYSTDYVPGGNIDDAVLKDITAFFTIPNGPSTGYPSVFTSSGTYNIPDLLTGNGFFFLEYNGNGNGGITTTLQVDSIVIK